MARVEQKLEDQGKSLERIEATLTKFIESADERYVSHDAFAPVRRIAYGLVTVILTTVVGAVMALVITTK